MWIRHYDVSQMTGLRKKNRVEINAFNPKKGLINVT